MVKLIIDDEENYSMEAINEAKENLSKIKKLKIMRKRSSLLSLKLQMKIVNFPEEFKCSFSKELMRDLIILAFGEVSLGNFFFAFCY